MASKEEKYIQQLKDLGIYEQAYDPAIHELCILERELSRARKQLKDKAADGKAPSYADPLYSVIRQLQTNILAYRDALGMTPKSLRKLRGNQPVLRTIAGNAETPLERMQKKHGTAWKSNTTA